MTLPLRSALVTADWRIDGSLGEEKAPFRALVLDSMRWSGGVVPAVDRETLDLLIREQEEMLQRLSPDVRADQDQIHLEGDVLVRTTSYGPDEDQRVEPIEHAGETLWILDLGWTFCEAAR